MSSPPSGVVLKPQKHGVGIAGALQLRVHVVQVPVEAEGNVAHCSSRDRSIGQIDGRVTGGDFEGAASSVRSERVAAAIDSVGRDPVERTFGTVVGTLLTGQKSSDLHITAT